MSAICGVWHLDGRPGAAEACRRIQRVLAPYGPDREGHWDGGEIALGSRLLRLLPEDRHDRQPLFGRGGAMTLVGDVRLDNRDELARTLGIDVGKYAMLSDADMLLRAVEQWGEAAVDRLIGDFAYAAWDAHERALLLVRSHVDGRPLFYHAGKGWFAFATLPKGLLALPDIPAAPNLARLAQWQVMWPHDVSASFFDGIQRLEPGHLARIAANGRVTVHRHWRPETRPMLKLANDADYAEGLRDAFDQAVRGRLRGVGGTGLMLSAGLDSAAVAVTAAPILAERGERLTAFTSVPLPGTPCAAHALADEGPLAALTAGRHANIDHRVVRAADGDLMADLERMTVLADQPMMNPVNTAWLCQIYGQARASGLSTILTGSRGNLGISHAGTHLLTERVGAFRWRSALREARALRRSTFPGAEQLTLRRAIRPWLPARLLAALRRYRGADPLADRFPIAPSALAGPWLAAHDWQVGLAADPPIRSTQEAILLHLRNVDAGPINAAIRAGYGIDRRDPTGDRRVLEFCISTPAEQFLRDGEPKRLYRRAFGDRIPPEVLAETRRGFQGADWKAVMLRQSASVRMEVERLANTPLCRELVDVDAMKALAATLGDATGYPHQLKFTRGLAAGLFLRKAIGANG